MEVRDYLRRRGAWLSILVVLPLIAALAAFSLLVAQPRMYGATLQVRTPTSSANSDSQIGLFVARYQQALTSPAIVQQASGSSGVRPSSLRAMTATRIGETNLIKVQLTSRSGPPANAKAISLSAALALQALATEGLSELQAQVDGAKARLGTVQGLLSAFQERTGSAFPVNEYQSLTNSINSLRSDQAAADSAGEIGRSAGDGAQVSKLDERRSVLASLLGEAQQLQSDVDSASAASQDAQQRLTATQSSSRAEAISGQLAQPATYRLSRFGPVIQGTVIAAIVGFVLGLLILTGPDLLRRSPSRRPWRGRAAVSSGPAETASHAGRLVSNSTSEVD
jgi:hypothetical protein